MMHDEPSFSFEPPVPAREWKYLVLHHTATDEGSVDSIDAAHRRRKDQFGSAWLGIGYDFVIGNGRGMVDGKIEPTFRWLEQLDGAHAGSRRHNLWGIGICLVGDFETAPPTPRQITATKQLIEWLANRFDIDGEHVLRHLDVAATRCPGRLFPYEEIRASLEVGLVGATGSATPNDGF